ncbi:MAG: TrkA C-terminal domain-containing protein, partial [Bacteroides sp.]|nr:TrkA C-terminal domain-containing protein [Bacteroides sp.]
VVDEIFPFIGKSIMQSEVGKKYNCLMVAIEQEEELITPDTNTRFEAGDVVWVAGEKSKIQQMIRGE